MRAHALHLDGPYYGYKPERAKGKAGSMRVEMLSPALKHQRASSASRINPMSNVRGNQIREESQEGSQSELARTSWLFVEEALYQALLLILAPRNRNEESYEPIGIPLAVESKRRAHSLE